MADFTAPAFNAGSVQEGTLPVKAAIVLALAALPTTLVSRRGCLVEQQRREMASWRSWGFRSWRLQRTLDTQQKS